MSSLRSKLPVILPLLIGVGLLCGITRWQPLAPIIPLEHSLFLFPERFEPDSHFPDHGQLADFQVTPFLFTGEDKPRSLGSYVIDDETRDIIDLTPDKWAYLLDTIRRQNQGLLIITAPLSWSDASELALKTLDHQISQAPNLVIGLNAEFNHTAAPLPPFLTSSVIATTSDSDFQTLPQIDFLPLPPSINAPLFGISSVQGLPIENSSSKFKIPMLVRWADSILPTTHLAALIAAHQLTPADVIITSSGHLRLGPKGTILKIDHQGRALFPNSGNTTRSASELLITPSTATSSKILLAAQSPDFLALLETHLTQALTQTPSAQTPYTRWPLPMEIAALIILTLIIQTRRLWLIIPVIALLFAGSVFLNHWFLATPSLLLLTTFFLIPRPKPPLEQKKEDSPEKTPPAKPVETATKHPAKKVATKAPKKASRKKSPPQKKKRR